MNQWHLLALGSVMAFAMVGPMKDVTLPLIVAAEVLFLSVVCHDPRFQRSVDAKTGEASQQKLAEESQKRFQTLYAGLDRDSRKRFDTLRERCEIINSASQGQEQMDQITEWQAQGVNKLLWVYLKLLNTHAGITRFLENTNQEQFERVEKEARSRLKALGEDPAKQKMRGSIEDTIRTIESRKQNLAKAKENLEFIGLELDRITVKLTTLSEMAVNRQDPSLLTSEVDDVAKSVQSTEQAIGELNMFASIPTEEPAPEIIGPERRTRQRLS